MAIEDALYRALRGSLFERYHHLVKTGAAIDVQALVHRAVAELAESVAIDGHQEALRARLERALAEKLAQPARRAGAEREDGAADG